jgi:hypothetical protein
VQGLEQVFVKHGDQKLTAFAEGKIDLKAAS